MNLSDAEARMLRYSVENALDLLEGEGLMDYAKARNLQCVIDILDAKAGEQGEVDK